MTSASKRPTTFNPTPAQMSRRTALGIFAGTLASIPAGAHAQTGTDWPNQPVRYVNIFPPGGATDTLSRLYCAKMSEIAGQQFVVENRSGSGGVVGAEVIAKARPDGYTVGLGSIEPPRVCRRLGSLSQAASATSCWLA